MMALWHIEQKCDMVRAPGFEPGLEAWEASVLTARLRPRAEGLIAEM